MKQYIYVLAPVRLGMLTDKPTDSEAAAIGDHLAFLEREANAGKVLLAGRSQTADENTFGIVIFSAESEAEAMAFMQSDPAVSGNAMTAELFPYHIAVVSKAILERD